MKLAKSGLLFSLAIGITFANLTPAHASKGGSSGGGGFYKRSPVLLTEAEGLISQKILKVDPAQLAAIMPSSWQSEGWTPARFASVLQNVCQEQSATRQRKGQALVFDYCDRDATSPSCQNTVCTNSNTDGQYISALSPFFEMSESHGYGADLQNSLLHEAVHLLGVGTGPNNDDDAQALAQKIENLANSAWETAPFYSYVPQTAWKKLKIQCSHLVPFGIFEDTQITSQTKMVAQEASLQFEFDLSGPWSDGSWGQMTAILTGEDGTILSSVTTKTAESVLGSENGQFISGGHQQGSTQSWIKFPTAPGNGSLNVEFQAQIYAVPVSLAIPLFEGDMSNCSVQVE